MPLGFFHLNCAEVIGRGSSIGLKADIPEIVADVPVEKRALRIGSEQLTDDSWGDGEVAVDGSLAELQIEDRLADVIGNAGQQRRFHRDG
jgi:hypothetical protein